MSWWVGIVALALVVVNARRHQLARERVWRAERIRFEEAVEDYRLRRVNR